MIQNSAFLGVSKKDCLSKHDLLPAIPGSVGSAWGTAEKPLTSPGLETMGLIVLFPLLPIYDAFLILFHTRSFSSLSWVISQSASALLDEGQKHDCYEKPLTS